MTLPTGESRQWFPYLTKYGGFSAEGQGGWGGNWKLETGNRKLHVRS